MAATDEASAASEVGESKPSFRQALLAGLGVLVLLGALALGVGLLGQGKQAVPAAGPSRSTPLIKPGSLRIMVLGDSLAGSLAPGVAEGLGKAAVVFNGGSPGCSLASFQLASNFRFTVPPGKPCVKDHPQVLVRTWRQWIRGWHPNLVLYLARNDLADQQIDGSWTHVGESAFDRYYQGRLKSALHLFSVEQLPVVLLVPNQAESGSRLNVAVPEEEPARRSALAAQLREGVARVGYAHPSFSVLDLSAVLGNRAVDSAGLTHAQLFCPDGAHFVSATGALVAKTQSSRWAALVAPVHPAPKVQVAVPALWPSWWKHLQCR